MDNLTDPFMALGRTAFERGDFVAAEAAFRDALAGGRNDVETLHFLGFLARARGDLEEAGDRYAAALEQAPTDAQLHNNLAEVRKAQTRHAEAIALYRRGMHLDPQAAEMPANLGGLLLYLRQPDAALPLLQRALALNPTLTAAHADIAGALCALNRYPESLDHYRAIHRLEPSNNSARYLEALAQLALGDFANGWRKHESRWYATLGADRRRLFPQPAWLGEDTLAGRTILLHAEQGQGDTLQFVRYAPLVAERGARVVLEVQAPLVPLLNGMSGIESVHARGDALPPFDLQCSLMSLPRAFRTELATVPAAVPYLTAPVDRVAKWAERLGERDGRRRIGMAWSGTKDPWNRSMPLVELAPLLDRSDCVFHALQTEIWPEDRATLDAWPAVVDLSAELADFADTAAVLGQMDLVLTVDTVLAHLGGALAQPTWTMLPLGSDYRWMTEGTTSPWYPTMRLFRQPALHDWAGVVRAVGQALDA